uniref:Uncharacterized protein n=1 Tax=Romanomermis culicivorax TaxID=13658 RepID=A0A915KGD2_ROMCU
MDVQHQEEIHLLELVRVNLSVMLANPSLLQGQPIVQTPSSQSLPTSQATVIPAATEPTLLPPPPAQFQTSAGTQMNTERMQKRCEQKYEQAAAQKAQIDQQLLLIQRPMTSAQAQKDGEDERCGSLCKFGKTCKNRSYGKHIRSTFGRFIGRT